MPIKRMFAITLQELFITRRSFVVAIDLFYWPIMATVVFGFINLYLSGGKASLSGKHIILGILLWEVVRTAQYATTVSTMWNVWSRNLSNMFISPLSVREYLLAQMYTGVIKTAFIFIIVSLITFFLFDFNIFILGPLNIVLYFANLIVFAWTVGIIILGVIFKFGTRLEALAWSTIFLFQPLSATFFPLNILPKLLQTVAQFIPATHIFEAARGNLQNPRTDWQRIGLASLENALYFTAAIMLFTYFFKKSCETGQFARNEG